MGKTIKFDPVAKELLTNKAFRGRIVKSKKGKGSYNRKGNKNVSH